MTSSCENQAIPEAMTDLQQIDKILVICLGNICRSPMAEGFLKKAQPGKMVISAGITAMTGFPADPFSVSLMQAHGIDIGNHRAQNLTDWMVQAADLILTMDDEQTRFIERSYPSFTGPIMKIGHHGEFDVPDPYRLDLDAFRHSQQLILRGVNDVIEHVLQAPALRSEPS